MQVFSDDDIWVVGKWEYHCGVRCSFTYPLSSHWNGTTWTDVVVPLPEGSVLRGITATGPDNVWAVGYRRLSATSWGPAILRWSGTEWMVVPSPSEGLPEGRSNYLIDVLAFPSGEMWATGYMSGPTAEPFLLVYGDLPPFADVLQGSTFYPYVRCLACQGIIGGYPCGGPGEPCDVHNTPYFRPGGSVTRGQIAKIVANAAGFSDPAGAQQFEDVVPGSTFYDYVWRLASRGYINGYPCGGPSEPCGAGNLPYFRPNSNATRGQITKIVSETAGFADPEGPQQFEDVLSGSTFSVYVYRLAVRGIMNGYPCGGPGEPCVPPDNLPYFRPNASATRGQLSKIAANTFFPGCDPPRR